MGAFDTANQLAILAGARAPAWEAQSVQAGSADTGSVLAPLRAPELASDGVETQNALYAMVDVPIRANPHRRKGVVTIGVFDAGSDYIVTLGGVAKTAANPHANVAAALASLAAAIHGGLYTATVVGSTVVFYGATDTDFSIVPSRSGGTGTLSIVADPSSASLRTYGIGRDGSAAAPSAWKSCIGPNGTGTFTADVRGVVAPMPCAGLSRVYVEVDSLAGHASDSTGTGGTLTYTTPTVTIGPCILENA